MTNIVKRNTFNEAVAEETATRMGWEYVSTEKQKNNGTHSFKINNSIYQHTDSGYLRCIRVNPKHMCGERTNYSLLQCSYDNRISFRDALKYLVNRFKIKEYGDDRKEFS